MLTCIDKKAESLLDLPDAKILEIAHQIRFGYRFKRIMRYKTTRDFSVHNESDAEHIFGMHHLSYFFLPLEDPQGKLDRGEVSGEIQFHESGEGTMKQDRLFCHKSHDNVRSEDEIAEIVFRTYPEPLRSQARGFYRRFRRRMTLESPFVDGIDKLEPAFELLDPVNEKSQRRNKVTFTQYKSKYNRLAPYPYMLRFGMVIGDDMNRRGVFAPE